MRKILFFYIFSELIPMFLLGIAIFIAIILMAQFMQLSEFLLIHNISAYHMSQVLLNMSISFLPMILPTSLLFAILLTYARLSSDSEIVAFKALGHSHLSLSLPALIFSILVCLLSAQTLFVVGPVARRNFDTLIGEIGNQKIMSSIKEGTFSEEFFDLVLYTNTVDEKKNILYDLFIFDRRNQKKPVAIVSKTGTVHSSSNLKNQTAKIVLNDGNMYFFGNDKNTQLKFGTYELSINSPVATFSDERDTNTYTMGELNQNRKNLRLTPSRIKEFEAEFQKRIATAIACIMFGFLGPSLGSSVNRRSSSSSGFVLSVVCIAVYWLLYSVMLGMIHESSLPPSVFLWTPNVIFGFFTLWMWLRQEKRV